MPEKSIGTGAYQNTVGFRNDESSASIEPGRPVVFTIDGTEDGFAAVLPVTAAAAKCPGFFAGIHVGSRNLLTNEVGTAQIWGLCNYAIFAQQTRSATTASFSTAAPLSVGQPLSIHTAAGINALVIAGAAGAITKAYVTGTAASDTLALTLNEIPAVIVAAQTVASAAASATTTSETRTSVTMGIKVFLRAM